MRTRGRAAFWWALVCLLSCGGLAAPRRAYCERADVAWRAYRAPAAFEARVQSLAPNAATVQVKRVFRSQGRWPREDAVLRLKLPQEPLPCLGRFELPLRNRRNYIVFAERRGHSAVALGPPLKRTNNLVKRVRAVYKPGYNIPGKPQPAPTFYPLINKLYNTYEQLLASKHLFRCEPLTRRLRKYKLYTLLGSPARVEQMQSVRTTRGSRVRLECKASARPPPRIAWYKDGRPVADIALRRFRVQSFRRRSVLVIRHARNEDSATYECRAQGAVGPPASTAANVTVLAPAAAAPEQDPISGSPCPMSSFCLNGGTCLYFELVQEQACKCPEGFNGMRCENKEATNRSSKGEPLW